MGSLERRTRHKRELRRQILDAARELFSTEGVDRVSMRGIAEKIEYSPKTLYLHFKDKGEILYHLCEEAFRKLDEEVTALGNDFPDAEAFIRAGLAVYVRFGLENPHDYKIAFLTHVRHYPYKSREELPSDSVILTMQTRMECAIQDCINRHVFRPIDPVLATHIFWVGVHGLTCAIIMDPDYRWVDKRLLIENTIDTLIRGLKN